MKKLLHISALALTVAIMGFTAEQSEAYMGFHFNPAFNYQQQATSGDWGSADSNTLEYSLKLGYGLPSGLYLGAIMDGHSNTVNDQPVGPTGYGVSIGYHSGGFFLQAHYFLSATYQTGASNDYSGTGIGVDFGYYFMVASNFALGPQLDYRTWTYTEDENNNTFNNGLSALQPKIGLAFIF
ncbi:MAG: hypothetical protein H6626_04760 [Pseudobdellovibrionaceae bacterium]|nr:hypothetical protein [Bdellovibrionales bacterium]USN48403.1 MAG: hypothetical protein H6626_04760 [Pseudobdellovibrionaceae bacterium]